MIEPDFSKLVDWLSRVGVVGVVVFVLVGFQQRWWYFAGEVEDLKAALTEQKEATAVMERDRDQWKLLYLTSVHAGERLASVATVALPVAEQTAS